MHLNFDMLSDQIRDVKPKVNWTYLIVEISYLNVRLFIFLVLSKTLLSHISFIFVSSISSIIILSFFAIYFLLEIYHTAIFLIMLWKFGLDVATQTYYISNMKTWNVRDLPSIINTVRWLYWKKRIVARGWYWKNVESLELQGHAE